MEDFFQVIGKLKGDKNHWTAVGVDGELAGQKAVLSKEGVLYRTEGFPEEILQELLDGLSGGPGLRETGQGRAPAGSVPGLRETEWGPAPAGSVPGLRETEWGPAPVGSVPGLRETDRGRVFVEALGNRKKLVLCGGGHVSAATLAIAKLTEFHVTVVEDRPEFAQAALKAGADEVICDDFTHGLKDLDTDADTYVVVMTRGHRHDLDCLRQLLRKEYAYLGMMGSRSRVRKIREQLKEEGFPEERIAGLHAPVGLPISAVTPAEIGVSILAEIIGEKNRTKRQAAYEKELADWLFSGAGGRPPAVLATIIARKGSAPRQAGTKMIIFADGSSLGTIGGGCMEAEVKVRARHMLAAGQERYATCSVDMTGREAEEEGLVCGGVMEIFLEIL